MARQAWRRKGEWDRDVLEHIRSMLLVLAALIDRAAGLPPTSLPTVERLHFLAVMGCGEAEVRFRIVAMACGGRYGDTDGFGGLDEAPVHAAGDAALLAARFRMLALAAGSMLAQAGPRPPSRHTFPSVSFPSRDARRTAQCTLSPPVRATSPPAGERVP